MLRVVMLDLGDTLVGSDGVLPNVPEALASLQDFETAAGEPLPFLLVSDYDMPVPPPTPAKIAAIFQQYRNELDGFGLSPFFQPPQERITLSTHAGVFKPDRRVFETALQRLGVEAPWTDCLFITENAGHIAAVRQLGMLALHFGAPNVPGADFSDWSEGPLLIAQLAAPASARNLRSALRVHLAATHHWELIDLQGPPQGDLVHARVHMAHPLSDPSLGELDGVRVEVPVPITIERDARGGIRSVQVGQPAAEDLEEAAGRVRTLRANRQIAPEGGPLLPGATHQVERDAEGQPVVKRRRFSAF